MYLSKVLLYYGRLPIKTRTKSFTDLEKLAIDGLNYHWGRNQNHFIAKNIEINGEKYQLFINAINTTENAMDDVSLIFNTNRPWMRSGNPGTVEDPISFVGNIVSREAICYNVGYIKHSYGWRFKSENNENLEFKFTSAHEIGHELLQAFGGTIYSWQHKGSSYYFPQDKKPTNEESFIEEHINIDFMEETSGETYPKGEIDLMKYYNGKKPHDFFERRIANAKDVLGLIWLSKIEIK